MQDILELLTGNTLTRLVFFPAVACLPLLFMLENNLYAQSTSQQETLAGDICARAAAFGIATSEGDTWNFAALGQTLKAAADEVRRTGAPAFVRVDTYRLAAHSKGDDDRDPQEIAR